MIEVKFSRAAEKDIRKLDKKIQSILHNEHIPKIEKEPFCGYALKYGFEGLYSYHFNYRGVQYRIVYEIYEKESLAVVIMVGPRERFYERLRRRIKGSL